jgi:16S rRNA (cytosine967-C5)-methyltransferase
LIDASGLGVLKETRCQMEIETEFIDNMRKIQSEVLESYSIVKPGGKMVYATCALYCRLKIKNKLSAFDN